MDIFGDYLKQCVRGCTVDGHCPLATPLCDAATQHCLQCGDDGDCSADGGSTCNRDNSTCVAAGGCDGGDNNSQGECFEDADCLDGQRPFCDVGAGVCIGCRQDEDCKGYPFCWVKVLEN